MGNTEKVLPRGVRVRLPKKRKCETYELLIGTQKIYVSLGLYPDGKVGELFVATAKDGSMLRTSLSCWAIAVSKALQFGMPMKEVIETFRHIRCNEGKVYCEEVPRLHGLKFASSWDAITALLEAETDENGYLRATSLPALPPEEDTHGPAEEKDDA